MRNRIHHQLFVGLLGKSVLSVLWLDFWLAHQFVDAFLPITGVLAKDIGVFVVAFVSMLECFGSAERAERPLFILVYILIVGCWLG